MNKGDRISFTQDLSVIYKIIGYASWGYVIENVVTGSYDVLSYDFTVPFYKISYEH